jgi:transcriptional regulator
MYIPEQYKNENSQEINAFLEQHAFGILINQTDGKLWATHIPLELDVNGSGKQVLHGHLSKANPQWKSFASDNKILAIFNGPHSYISSSWYEKEEVPTWNYIAVHVYGTIKIVGEEALLDSLKKLVDKYESHSENPVRVEELSEKTMRQINGIVGFVIEIDDIQAVKKMSQTRNDKDHQNIVSELQKTGNPDAVEVANVMGKCPR